MCSDALLDRLVLGSNQASMRPALQFLVEQICYFARQRQFLKPVESKDIADTAVALYGLPMKLVEVGMMYGTIFLNSLLPVLTLALEKNDTAKFRKVTRHALLIMLL